MLVCVRSSGICARQVDKIKLAQGIEEVVAAIIQQRSTLEQRDKAYRTPLQVAERRKQGQIVKMLMEAGGKGLEPLKGNLRPDLRMAQRLDGPLEQPT